MAAEVSKVAISGSRSFEDHKLVEGVVARLLARGDTVLVGDSAFGVDRFVREYLDDFEIPRDRWVKFEALWRVEGRFDRGAGFARNARMVAEADELVAIFAPGPRSPGTAHALSCAVGRGIPTHVYENGEWVR